MASTRHPIDPARAAELLASGRSYQATADQLGVRKHVITRTVAAWRADPATLPAGHDRLLEQLANRHRNPQVARAAKTSVTRQRAKEAAARRRAALVARIAAGHGVDIATAEDILTAAENETSADAARRALTPPLKPAQAARRLPPGIHPRSARATRLRPTQSPRRA